MGSVLAAVAAVAAVFSHTHAVGPARAQTLYTDAGKVAAFAQDGPDVAFFVEGGSGCNTVHLLSLSDGLHTTLPSQSMHNVTCRFAWDPRSSVGLALAQEGGRLLWTLPQRTPLQLDYLLGAGLTPVQRPERRFLEVAHTARGVGQWLGGIAGDSSTLVYAVTSVDYQDEAGCLAGSAPCTLAKSGGGVYRIRGRNVVPIPKAVAAVAVAAAGSAVAYVPTGGIGPDGRPRAAADVPIEIVDSVSGREISSVVPQGVPRAIALSAHVLATLEQTPLGLRLAWYDRATGKARGSIPVPKTTTPSLSATDQLVVFRVGRSIRGVSVDSHHVRVLVRAAAQPLGLSIQGARVAWAENRRGVYRIEAFYDRGSG